MQEGIHFDFIITTCNKAHETCPTFHNRKALLIHQGFDDPPHITKNYTEEEQILEVFRRVRDEIRLFVDNLPANLEKTSNSL